MRPFSLMLMRYFEQQEENNFVNTKDRKLADIKDFFSELRRKAFLANIKKMVKAPYLEVI